MQEPTTRKEKRVMHANDGESRYTYTCAQEGCTNTERPTLMYNLSCNFRTVTPTQLLKLVRCRGCAERIAKEKGLDVGDSGCGVHPLALTLRQMNRKEDDPVPAGAVTYSCSAAGCTISRRAEDMYNLEIGRPPTNIEVVQPFIRCGAHAQEAAEKRGKEPCEPGSGVYRLSHTIRWFSEIQLKRASSPRNPKPGGDEG